MRRTIYLDYNATTPLDPAVRETMMPYLSEVWGNPSSVHHVGQKARASLDDARDRAACLLKCKPSEVVFTSGGTESNNLAVFGAARFLKPKGRHIISSAIEHHAVLHCLEYLAKHEGFEVTLLPVSQEGIVSVESLENAIRRDTILVSIMAANNEIGSVQPVSQLGAVCKAKGVLFHTDAVQWFGKEPFDSIDQFSADLVSICSHKFHGPKGAGILYIRSPLLPNPILFGGGHENERRAGTENLASIIGMVEAMERFVRRPVFDRSHLAQLTSRITSCLKNVEGVKILGAKTSLLPNTVAFLVENSDSVALLAGFDLEGICASGGAACSAGSLEPSHVVKALGFGPDLTGALVRFSSGRENTDEEISFVLDVIPKVIQRARHSKQPHQ